MTTYISNFTRLLSGQNDLDVQDELSNSNCLKIIIPKEDVYVLKLNSPNESESASDSDYEYHKIHSRDIQNFVDESNNKVDINYQTIKSVQEDYNKIYTDLLKKEQLVRKRVNSDTVEKIKANYSDYINDDIQIIKDFAIIMETFEHIKDRLKVFETDIKDFEEGIKKNTINQDENKQELDNKINNIDSKLENTIDLMNQIKSNGDKFIEKIIHLENLIKTHEEHRNEIMKRLEKFDQEHNEMKNNNLQVLNFFRDYQKYWLYFSSKSKENLFNNQIGYIGIGLGIGLLCYNFVKKN